MDRKRTIILILFILAIFVFGYALYAVFLKGDTTPTTGPVTTPGDTVQPGDNFPQAGVGTPSTPPGGTTGLPTSDIVKRPIQRQETIPQVGEVSRLVSNIIADADIDPNGNLQFYNRENGQFFRLNENGEIELLSDQVFFNVQNVTWSPTRNETIIEYPDGANIYYNFNTKKQVTLPTQWQDFSFSDQGEKIAAKSIGFSPENRWLITSDPEGKSVNLVEELGTNGDRVIVDWSPNKQIVAMSMTGEALGGDRQELLFVGLNGENFRSTVVEGRGLVSQWSPSGDKLLYSVYSALTEFKPLLWIVDTDPSNIGSNRKPLSVNTWADKCTFEDDRYVYCGVPQTLRSGAGFAREVADDTPDDIVRIDTVTGLQTRVATDRPPVVDDIFLSPDGQTLYFTDKSTDGLFSVRI